MRKHRGGLLRTACYDVSLAPVKFLCKEKSCVCSFTAPRRGIKCIMDPQKMYCLGVQVKRSCH